MGYESEGFIEGERIAKLSVWTHAGLGLVEIITGQVTGSIGLTADGIDSFSDAFITSVVWLERSEAFTILLCGRSAIDE